MVGIGALLIVLGLGSLVLPMLDMQFTLMSFLDEYQPVAGIAAAAIGAALVLMGSRRKQTTVVVQQPPAAPPAPPAT